MRQKSRRRQNKKRDKNQEGHRNPKSWTRLKPPYPILNHEPGQTRPDQNWNVTKT